MTVIVAQGEEGGRGIKRGHQDNDDEERQAKRRKTQTDEKEVALGLNETVGDEGDENAQREDEGELIEAESVDVDLGEEGETGEPNNRSEENENFDEDEVHETYQDLGTVTHTSEIIDVNDDVDIIIMHPEQKNGEDNSDNPPEAKVPEDSSNVQTEEKNEITQLATNPARFQPAPANRFINQRRPGRGNQRRPPSNRRYPPAHQRPQRTSSRTPGVPPNDRDPNFQRRQVQRPNLWMGVPPNMPLPRGIPHPAQLPFPPPPLFPFPAPPRPQIRPPTRASPRNSQPFPPHPSHNPAASVPRGPPQPQRAQTRFIPVPVPAPFPPFPVPRMSVPTRPAHFPFFPPPPLPPGLHLPRFQPPHSNHRQ